SRLTTGQSVGSEELAFAIFGSTGAGTNLQQFDLTRFEYTAGGSYIAIKYIDDVTGEEIRTEKIIQGDPGTQKDLSDDITLAGYIQKRTNINTSQGYMDGNTLQFVKGIQTLTYTYIAVNKEILTNLVEESSQIKASQKYLYSSSNKKVEYDMVIEMGKKVLSNIDATQTDVDNAVETIEQARNGLDGQLIIDKTEEAVKAAEDAGKAGADKKAEVETDGLVTPDEKAAVDGMNDTTTAKKEEASQLVDALPEGPVKDSLKARLDQVVTSEVTSEELIIPEVVHKEKEVNLTDNVTNLVEGSKLEEKKAIDIGLLENVLKEESKISTHNNKALPKTGANNNSLLSILGLSLISISSLLFGFFRKKEEK
ncbi:LPXTG cell wall anchor domain-containing protein, partial [Enterococcus faecalis]|nr:LPXTG cell wall anchor domain-containing protein [Enterococcus faecalis]